MNHLIEDIYPNKAQFLDGEEIEIVIEWKENIIQQDIYLKVSRLDEVVLTIEKTIKIDNKFSIIKIEPLEKGGYGIDLYLNNHISYVPIYSTAFDVVKSHKDSPRYGFLSEFEDKDEQDFCDILFMKKLHINMVQFYDWMYRHDDLVSDENNYTDLMGKKILKTTIFNKIRLCHENGMKAIAYGAIYAASKNFYDTHKDWALYYSNLEPIVFIDIFYIMDIREKSPWHQHIISEYEKTIKLMNFDGIHMDTYGFPKKGISVLEGKKKIVYLDEEIPGLINNTKEKLQKTKDDVTLIFNNVGNWPVKATSHAGQDMIYIEVWDPYSTYNHLQQIIHEARNETNKPIILAAYLKPFMSEQEVQAGYALKLITASIFANGAYHLVLGEDHGILTQGYYVDYYKISPVLFSEIRKYYDFMIRYSDLFYDQSLRDVSMTHAYGDNKEYIFEGDDFSASADSNKIWTIVRENKNVKLISLINLKGNDVIWNKGKQEPVKVKKLTIKVQLEKEVESVFVSSPERIIPEKISYQIVEGERGNTICLDLNELFIWKIVVIKLCKD